ncbi:alpha/beta-hydrolase, partial [Eremomyces bilateralis CBS 781.70]
IIGDNPGTTLQHVVYPATAENYAASTRNGSVEVQKMLRDNFETCPSTKIVLLAYSEGANALGDALCGGGVLDVETVEPGQGLGLTLAVVAIILWGDTRFNTSETFAAGTAHQNGLFPRPANESCEYYAPRLQSYCDDNDMYCASGDSEEVHISYADRYNTKSLEFCELEIAEGKVDR